LYSSSVKNTILHDINGKIDKGLIDLLDNYRRNNYKELKYVSLRQHILPPVYTRTSAGGREDLCSLLPYGSKAKKKRKAKQSRTRHNEGISILIIRRRGDC